MEYLQGIYRRLSFGHSVLCHSGQVMDSALDVVVGGSVGGSEGADGGVGGRSPKGR